MNYIKFIQSMVAIGEIPAEDAVTLLETEIIRLTADIKEMHRLISELEDV